MLTPQELLMKAIVLLSDFIYIPCAYQNFADQLVFVRLVITKTSATIPAGQSFHSSHYLFDWKLLYYDFKCYSLSFHNCSCSVSCFFFWIMLVCIKVSSLPSWLRIQPLHTSFHFSALSLQQLRLTLRPRLPYPFFQLLIYPLIDPLCHRLCQLCHQTILLSLRSFVQWAPNPLHDAAVLSRIAFPFDLSFSWPPLWLCIACGVLCSLGINFSSTSRTFRP